MKDFYLCERWENSGILRTINKSTLIGLIRYQHKIFNCRYSRREPFKMHQGELGRRILVQMYWES